MIITVGIGHVGGDQEVSITITGEPLDEDCTHIHDVLNFLHLHDHEGSSLGGSIRIEDAEELYHVLRILANNPMRSV